MTLPVALAGIPLQNPLLLAAGTAGYGDEIEGVTGLDDLGGIVTKAVSRAPRAGAPAPRVAEFRGGMVNAVGLANPGADEVRRRHLPWLASHLGRAKVIVNVVGFTVDEFADVIERLDDATVVAGYEINVSCPNARNGGLEFGADPAALEEVVSRARKATRRPMLVKLSPALADVGAAARIALDAGANGISVVNTLPGLVVDVDSRRPALGFGTGGVSGPALLPIGVLATWRVWRATRAPIVGVGGIGSGSDALQYIMAGATAFGIGTAALRDPRAPGRVLRELSEWCNRRGVTSVSDLRGSLEWPA